MDAATLGSVPAGCRRRLLDHYGMAVRPWLGAVPGMLAEAVRRWGVQLSRYHDAGCASVLAVGSLRGQPVIVKAWYSPQRYVRELAALRAWAPAAPRLFATAPDLHIAAMALVGGRPGGALRPAQEEQAVAASLAALHHDSPVPEHLPRLRQYIDDTVRPRIHRRRSLGADIPPQYLTTIDRTASTGSSPVLLHGDLYQDNVPFSASGQPVFLDPLPMVGTPAFDWAFWTVYYRLGRHTVSRLHLAADASRLPLAELVPWCLLLCVDGLLYYRDSGDRRAPVMAAVMHEVADYDRQGASW
ncbi:hypothetical protein Athai_38690 [Actinocatenispora thailandica]|uniref:Aminoglycoside phosphotransferase domain-containing protein n=1 Tax=Actinocatenispora thailandica TaxID=227318 RepID=A0A7R7HY98_9ACTN|nr:fructosamine kinase family protein [Actinocatenispora thailandica]BCJ36366.1 hypothetical protein Athai_38690 [Actinocatenispora thailandica]